ncbi:MAG: 3'-5' exonuclease [Anaerovoracaceae bacterium]
MDTTYTLSFSISDGTITFDEKNNNKKRGGRNKGKSLLDFPSELTGITNKMLEQAPPLASVLSEFQNFIGNSTLVGHNANFDINFLYDAFLECLGTELKNNYIDTLRLARRLLPDLKRQKLVRVIPF